MSDFSTQGQQNDAGTGAPTGDMQGQGSELSEDSLASPFLQNVPEADREIVGRYIKHWDQNVQGKFKSIHDQYAPYKELGDPNELQQAVQLLQVIQNDPKQIYDLLAEEFGQTQGQPQGQQPPEDDPFEGLPDGIKERFGLLDKHEQVLETLAEHFLSQQELQRQQAEDAAFDQYFDSLVQKHGDPGPEGEEYILMKMEKGVDGDKAFQAWQQLAQGRVNQAQAPNLPPSLSGGGATNLPAPDVNKLTSTETQNLVAQLLEQANNQ